MQTYLQPEELERTGLSNFDDWVKTFAVPEQVCEIDVTAAGYRLTQRFSRFQNLPELSQMLAKICVFHAMTDEKGLPYFEDYTHVRSGHHCRTMRANGYHSCRKGWRVLLGYPRLRSLP